MSILVSHTNGRSIKNMIDVVMNHLVGMGLEGAMRLFFKEWVTNRYSIKTSKKKGYNETWHLLWDCCRFILFGLLDLFFLHYACCVHIQRKVRLHRGTIFQSVLDATDSRSKLIAFDMKHSFAFVSVHKHFKHE